MMRACMAMVLAVSVLFGAWGAMPAFGQDAPKSCEQQLREVQERLRQSENAHKELVRELERLRKENESLRSAGSSQGPPRPAKTRAPLTHGPLSSPKALFEALVKDYGEKVAPTPRETKQEQAAYLRKVQDWTRSVAKDLRGPVTWDVTIVKVDAGKGSGLETTFHVLDDQGHPIEPAVTQLIPMRFGRVLGPSAAGKSFLFVGTAGASPAHNPQRADAAGDDSTFIGPFAEFEWDLTLTDVREKP